MKRQWDHRMDEDGHWLAYAIGFGLVLGVLFGWLSAEFALVPV